MKTKFCVFLVILVLLISGCAGNSPVSVDKGSSLEKVTDTPLEVETTSTITELPTSTETPIPTKTLTPTLVPTATKTATITPTSTETPVPTPEIVWTKQQIYDFVAYGLSWIYLDTNYDESTDNVTDMPYDLKQKILSGKILTDEETQLLYKWDEQIYEESGAYYLCQVLFDNYKSYGFTYERTNMSEEKMEEYLLEVFGGSNPDLPYCPQSSALE